MLYRTVQIVGMALVAGTMLFHARFSLVLSVGESMEPTLGRRALLLVDRAAYRHGAPARADIVVARHLGEWIVKRVVGLPGERVGIQSGQLVVNGVPRIEAHPTLPGPLRIRAGTLQADRYALLGDNRSLPANQAVHAVVAADQLLGRVITSLPLSSP